MTRCYKSSSTLKSSVFNQTGQTFIDQIEVQRTLCSHFRRVLTAKSVVDSRNPKYIKMIQRKTRPSTAKKFLLKCPSDETIDKLAYDTEHHPCDLVRVQCRSKSTSHDRSWSGDRQRPINNDANYPRPKAHTSRERSSTGKLQGKNQKRPTTASRSQQRAKDKCGSTTCRSTRSRGCKYDEISEQRSVGGGCSPNFPCGYQLQESSLWRFEEQCCQSEEEARYARFVYDITQEIVQNGLYTDCELKEVFEKHLRKNSGHLNRRKMLYEIYQLKISLNMMDDTEDEDEVETDLVFAEKFATHRVPKPPTPPKVLNENKVIEKLESFRQFDPCRPLDALADSTLIQSPCRKSVTLVDANPEFLVTERDVLSTLADNHVEPQKIQRICRNLYQKSKDMSLCEAVQVGSEVAYTYRLKQVDRCTSATSLNDICYSKKESRGILRKECGTASKSLSPIAFRKFGTVKVKRFDGQEKCARWALGECGCEDEPCRHSTEPPERLKKSSSMKLEDCLREQASKAQQTGPIRCVCNCDSKQHHEAHGEASSRQRRRSSLKKPRDSAAYSDIHIKCEKFQDDDCDCEAVPCSESAVPPLKLRRSTISIPSEEEKWKAEDSSDLLRAKKEDAPSESRKLSKFSDEKKCQSRKLRKKSNQESDQSQTSNRSSEQSKDRSRRSSRLSNTEKEQSRRSSKLMNKEKDKSRKSSKSSAGNENETGKPNKLTALEIDEQAADVEEKNLKNEKSRPSKSMSDRDSSSESSISDTETEARHSSKIKEEQTDSSVSQTPVVMKSRVPSEFLLPEKRVSTESSEITSESDDNAAKANRTQHSSQLTDIESKDKEVAERSQSQGSKTESRRAHSPSKIEKISLTTSADTSLRTSGETDIDYSKYVRRSTVESPTQLADDIKEPAPHASQERKKDVPKDPMPTKAHLVTKIPSKISEPSVSNSNKSTPAENVLVEKLERIRSSDDVKMDIKVQKPRTSILHKSSNGVAKSKRANNANKLSFNIKNSPKPSVESKRSSLDKKHHPARIAESSENEEIEEEIDTASETTARSPREQMKKQKERQSEKEADKKQKILAREVAKALEAEEDEKDEKDEDEEERYSDDFSEESDSPRKSTTESEKQRRMPSMRDFLESFKKMNEPKALAIHESSSSSGAGSPSMLSLNVPDDSREVTAMSSPTVKKRTSSGLSGYKVMESWNERLSEVASDFVNPVAKFCEPRCRGSLIAKTCSKKCKFVKTNCAHLTEPTNCLKSDVESDVSSQGSYL